MGTWVKPAPATDRQRKFTPRWTAVHSRPSATEAFEARGHTQATPDNGFGPKFSTNRRAAMCTNTTSAPVEISYRTALGEPGPLPSLSRSERRSPCGVRQAGHRQVGQISRKLNYLNTGSRAEQREMASVGALRPASGLSTKMIPDVRRDFVRRRALSCNPARGYLICT